MTDMLIVELAGIAGTLCGFVVGLLVTRFGPRM